MSRFITIFVVIAAVTVGAAYLSGALIEDEQEEPVALEQLPAAVRNTILREAGDGVILEIVREREGGQVVYEAEILLEQGDLIEIEVATDGTVLEREAADAEDGDDDEEEGEEDDDEEGDRLPVSRIPAPALRTIEEYTGGRDFVASMEREHGVTVYEARWEAAGRPTEVAVTADGALLEIEEMLAADAVPAAVWRTADELLPGAAERTVARKLVVIYEVEAVIDGREHEVLILPTGQAHDHH